MTILKCIYVYKEHNIIKGYKLQDEQGKTVDIRPNQLKQAIRDKKIQVLNLKMTRDNRLIQNKQNDMQSNIKNKLERLRVYESKQSMLGRIFDFRVNRLTNEISIYKYYDTQNIETVCIPDFVDTIEHREIALDDDIEYDMTGIFCETQSIKNVIMHSNVHGSLKALFYGIKGQSLSLTDFDMINITDTRRMFEKANLNDLILGNKFNTSNVKDMAYMFYLLEGIKVLNLGNKFNTSNVTDMDCMFAYCDAQEILLGNSFYTKNVESMFQMFSECNAKIINLGDNFDTHNVKDMNEMFANCQAHIINLGNKFDVSNAGDIQDMFSYCTAHKITIGHGATNLTIQRLRSLTNIPIEVK